MALCRILIAELKADRRTVPLAPAASSAAPATPSPKAGVNGQTPAHRPAGLLENGKASIPLHLRPRTAPKPSACAPEKAVQPRNAHPKYKEIFEVLPSAEHVVEHSTPAATPKANTSPRAKIQQYMTLISEPMDIKENDKNSLHAQLSDSHAALTTSHTTIQAVISEKNALQAQLTITHTALQDAISEKNALLAQLNTFHAAAQATISEKNALQAQLTNSHTATRAAITEKNTLQAQLSDSHTAAITERNTLLAKLSDTQTVTSTAITEKNNLHAKLIKSHAAAQAATVEKDAMLAQLSKASAVIEDTNTELDAVAAENEFLKLQLLETQIDADNLNIEYQLVRKGGKFLLNKNRDLQSELDAVRRELATMEQDLAAKEAEDRAYRASMAISRAHVARLETRRPDAVQDASLAKGALVAKCNELQQAQDRVAALEARAKAWECTSKPECENCEFHLTRALKISRASERDLGKKLDEAHLRWIGAEDQLQTWIGMADNYAVVFAEGAWRLEGEEEVRRRKERREEEEEEFVCAAVWTPPATQEDSDFSKESAEENEESEDKSVELILDRDLSKSSSATPSWV
ncbi:hypothetical protein BCR34DRAFT_636520 [Clohesyomyces aquaticus]|uniref:Uncharacterized protein n=1 Tax=Clohesyomyces aquaticus TaxID=1231657 RepID=A0A1Y1YW26_9PLEO|nr:hypothetical protein BCR34DRAFT_636520 [Clohesyomyces aquaticus]